MKRVTREDMEVWLTDNPVPVGAPAVKPGLLAMLFVPYLTKKGKALDHERMAVLALDAALMPIDLTVLTKGNDTMTVCCPRQIFRWLLTRRRPVSRFAVAHNHPSGNATPSASDIRIAANLRRAGEVLNLPLIDALVLGSGGSYESIANLEGWDAVR